MTFAIANKPYELSMDQLIYGLDKFKTNIKDYFERDEFLKVGKKTEVYLINLIKLLDVQDTYVVPKYSTLDCVYQVDIVVKCHDKWFGFQVKSGQYRFNRHIKRSSIGVVMCTPDCESLKLLIELSKWLNVDIKSDVKSELSKWRKVKQLNIKSRADRRVKLFNINWKLLTQLKLVRFNGELLVY